MTTLSILIPTVPSRLKQVFPSLVTNLLNQAENHPDVEIIGLFDNKKRSVGDKRNDLLNLARGKYLTFVDDDDRLADDYLDTVMPCLRERHLDVLVYEQEITTNGGSPKRCVYGVEYEYFETADLWTGKPAHTMVWLSEIAKKERFPCGNRHEDIDWCRRMARHVQPHLQHRIDKVLYHYRFNTETTETQR